MRMRALLAGVCLAALTSSAAWADLPVVDFGAIGFLNFQVANSAKEVANQVQQLANDTTKITNLVATLNALRHGNVYAASGLISQLNGMGLANPLSADAQGMADALQGLGMASLNLGDAGSQLASEVRATLSSGSVFLPSGITWRDPILAADALAAATQTATAQRSLQASDERLQQLRALQGSGGTARDVTDAANFAGRAGAETAIGTAQSAQLLAVMVMMQARRSTTAAQAEQTMRCEYARLAATAEAAEANAKAGMVQLVTNTATVACGTGGGGGTGGGANVSLVSTSAGDGGGFGGGGGGSGGSDSMQALLANSWGQTAADNATALGINPTAFAAACVLESGCKANVGGSGTISGLMQMSDGTYQQTVAELRANNPDLASQISTKNDPISQGLAASQYLLDAGHQQQAAGITPTVLSSRSYYQWGPGNSLALANASDNALMIDTISGFSNPGAVLKSNGLTSSSTVGDWRQSIINKVGANTANTPLFLTGGTKT
jgi:hypothetical protein